jgi:hypothetical protein
VKPIEEIFIEILPLQHRVQGVGEPFLELLMGFKYVRHEEVHQTPQFHQRVLQWRASQQEPVLGIEIE